MTPARRNVNLFTPRDLFAITDNPAKLRASDIARQFGVSEQRAREVRELACRSPEAFSRHLDALEAADAPWWRPLGWAS
jgi:hypothetical protein